MLFPTISIVIVTLATIGLLLVANWLVWGVSYHTENADLDAVKGGQPRVNLESHDNGGFKRVA